MQPQQPSELALNIEKLLRLAGRTVTLDVIPKGYLTRISAGLSIAAGAGMMASSLLGAIHDGTWDQVDYGEGFGMIMAALGGIGHGLGRKIEAGQAATQAALAAPNPAQPA